MDPWPESIAEAVRRLRTNAGLSQGALAARAGVSERSVRNIESGAIRRPQRDVMRRVSEAVGLDLSVLRVGAGLRIGVLGPFVVEAGSVPADVGPAKQRSLLALLALRPGIPVGNDEVVDFLWGDRPPASCVNLVHTYASRLRRALQGHGPSVQLSSVRGGYRLTADADALDLLRFEERVEAAQRSKAVEVFEQALDCWRGPILSGMPTSLRQHPGALAAERRRLNTALEYADVALAEGGCDAERLHALTDAEPLHEGLHARLMLALAADGQQAAALRVFDDIRARLDDDLGVLPGPELREAHLRVLRDGQRPSAVIAGQRTQTPRQLPADVSGFVGRAEDLERLDGMLAESAGSLPVLSIVGPPGVGKTTLAVRWAHRVAHRYTDGQLYVNLRGYDQRSPMQTIEALARFLRALGVPAERVPVEQDEAAALYRTLLDERKVLIVLDNASPATELTPLLPGSATGVVVVTSRDYQSGLAATHGAQRLNLDLLAPAEAHALLSGTLGAPRADAEPTGVEALARACGYLPLALRVVGADLDAQPHVSAESYAAELADRGGLAAGDAIRAAFDVSYERLEPDSQRAFRLLGLVPGPDFGADVVAALTDTPLAEARRCARRLVAASLLQPLPHGRFRFHDLLRVYAAARVNETEPEARRSAIDRLYGYYLRVARASTQELYPSMQRAQAGAGAVHQADSSSTVALAWLDAERAALREAVIQAPDLGAPAYACQLIDAMRGYLSERGCGVDMLAPCEAALEVAQKANDRPAEASMHNVLGMVHYNLSDYRRAVQCHTIARTLYTDLGDRREEATALHNLGRAVSQVGDVSEQLRCHEEALELSQSLGDTAGEARDLNYVGVSLLALGELAKSETYCLRALALSRTVGDRVLECRIMHALGLVYWARGDLGKAIDQQRKTMDLIRSFGLDHGVAATAVLLAESYMDIGRDKDAEEFAILGLTIARSVGDRRHEVSGLEMVARIMARRGQHEEARKLFDQAIEHSRQMGYHFGHAVNLLGLARLERQLGRPERAARLCLSARDVFLGSERFMLEATTLVEHARACFDLSELAAAESHAAQALELARSRGERLVEAHALAVLGSVCTASGDVERATDRWRDASLILDDLDIPDTADIRQEVTAKLTDPAHESEVRSPAGEAQASPRRT